MENGFKVSVIIPVYNAEEYVQEAVLSANKLSEVGEIILIDDGSKDKSKTICSELEGKLEKVRFFWHQNHENKGVSATRNVGILKSRFPYIAFLDSDDKYLPNRFNKDREIFEKSSKNIGGVFNATDSFFTNESAKELFKKDEQPYFATMFNLEKDDDIFKKLIWQNNGSFLTPSITIRKSTLLDTGLFDQEIYLGEDVLLWYKIAAISELLPGELEKAVASRRIHLSNTIHTDKSKYKKQRILLFKKLFVWMAFRKDIHYNRLNELFILINAYNRFQLKKNTPINNLIELIRFAPKILFTPFFYKKIIQNIFK